MAKQRIVNTRFWDDSYVSRMNPNEKLVFLYLLTNPLTTIAGVYELSTKRVSFDIGLSTKEIGKVLEKLEKDKKIIRNDDWIGIVNFIRYQSPSPKIQKGIEIELKKSPQELVKRLPLSCDMHAAIGLDRLSHPNTNLNPNLKTNSNFNASSERKLSTGFPPDVERMRKTLARKMRFDS